MEVPFLDLKAQYQSIKDDVDSAIQRVVDSCAFASGPEVEKFEEEFAKFCGASLAAGVNSGTAALELMFRACDIGLGDEVIVPANTFFATAEAVTLAGAKPVFVDVVESTGLMDPSKLESVITDCTKAIVPVHLWGQPADMDPILEIGSQHGLLVLEDSAQAHGAMYKRKKAGSIGTAAAFSFYPGKNLGAYGEAGAVTSNSEEIIKNVRMLRDHGSSQKYVHELIGRNDRMDGIQGAVLSVKLQHLDEWNAKRREHANAYRDALQGEEKIKLFDEMKGVESVYHLFVVRVKDRARVQELLKEEGIASGIHYPVPVHLQPAYSSLGYTKGDFPISEMLAEEILSLPMFPEMTTEQIQHVCTALKTCL